MQRISPLFLSFLILLPCLFTVIHALSGGPPPGGKYSDCCDFNYQKSCKWIPVDPNFKAGTCDEHESSSGISCATRRHFMNETLNRLKQSQTSQCPSQPYAAIMVNHTKGPDIEDAEIVCEGINDALGGGYFAHAETILMRSCMEKLKAENPGYFPLNRLPWQQLSLYTTGEPCPMCMMTARWQHVGEIVWSVSMEYMDESNWYQPQLFPETIQRSSNWCQFGGETPSGEKSSFQTRIVTNVLEDEIQPHFAWRFQSDAPCPPGCSRDSSGSCAEN